MDGAQILDIGRDGIWVMILVAAPMMTVGLVVGIVIALFQALTQIQEQTLVFVPKILAIFVTMVIALPFMGATMSAYMVKLADLKSVLPATTKWVSPAQRKQTIAARAAAYRNRLN